MEQASKYTVEVKDSYIQIAMNDNVTVESLKKLSEEFIKVVDASNKKCVFVNISLINYGEVPIDVKIKVLTLIHYSRDLRVAIFARDSKIVPLVQSAISFAGVKDYQVFQSQKEALSWLLEKP